MMAGNLERCFYCGDSRGTDVDHYRPLTVHQALAFDWDNHLLSCAACNRAKATKDPVDSSGTVYLLDPTKTNPWDHFFYDGLTGNLAPRYVGNDPDPLAVTTLEFLPTLLHEPVTEGRAQCSRRLFLYLRQSRALGCAGDVTDLLDVLGDDAHGLGRWYSDYEGAKSAQIVEFEEACAELWAAFSAALRK